MSTLSLRKIKHDSSVVDNITLASDGTTGFGTTSPDGKVDIEVTSGVNLALTKATGASLSFNDGVQTRAAFQGINGADGLTIHTGSAWTERMRIDASGRVTTPAQPAFAVYNNATQSFSGTGTQVVDMTNAVFDKANSFNLTTNLFTAPVAGVYVFTWSGMMMGQTTATTFVNLSIRVNGGIYYENMQQSFSKSDYNSITGSAIMNLSANDTVDWVIYYAGANSGSNLRAGSNMNLFMGYLLG